MNPNNDPDAKWSKLEIFTVISIPAITIVWAIIVFLSGKGVNLTGVEWDFGRTALLGDSFGVVGALMATAAAFFTYKTMRDERAENFSLRAREAARALADKKREAETTFFQLLKLRNSILERVRYKPKSAVHTDIFGQQAIQKIAKILNDESKNKLLSQQNHYDSVWQEVEGELGHYLRFTYHIIKFVEKNFKFPDEKYEYIRLLRAQLSNAEAEIIALNCIFGAGNPHMKKYVEDFSLLHNLPKNKIELLKSKSFFDDSAFGRDP